MKKRNILFPLSLIAGAIATVGSAILFAKNDKVKNVVKKSSVKVLEELKAGVSKAKVKLDESKDSNDESAAKFKSFLSKTLEEISNKLEKADKESVESTLDALAANINKAIVKFDEVKDKQIDPTVKSAVDSLKETVDNLSNKVK